MVCFYLIVLPKKGVFSESHQILLEISGYTFAYTVKSNETLGTYLELPALTSSYYTVQLDSERQTAQLCEEVSFRDGVVRLFDSNDLAGIERLATRFAYTSADW